LNALAADESLKTNAQRVAQREVLLPQVRELIKRYSKAELVPILERTGLPFAPIGKPEEMFDDPHLAASGGLGPTVLPDGRATRLPILPIEMDGHRPSQGGTLARPGEHTDEVLAAVGYAADQIRDFRSRQIVG
jgi:crotonobetainyl-CoA:carnitine CoA-transferase CaiB-like acyl-CoA transferase